jgi:hypothetical protein
MDTGTEATTLNGNGPKLSNGAAKAFLGLLLAIFIPFSALMFAAGQVGPGFGTALLSALLAQGFRVLHRGAREDREAAPEGP